MALDTEHQPQPHPQQATFVYGAPSRKPRVNGRMVAAVLGVALLGGGGAVGASMLRSRPEPKAAVNQPAHPSLTKDPLVIELTLKDLNLSEEDYRQKSGHYTRSLRALNEDGGFVNDPRLTIRFLRFDAKDGYCVSGTGADGLVRYADNNAKFISVSEKPCA